MCYTQSQRRHGCVYNLDLGTETSTENSHEPQSGFPDTAGSAHEDLPKGSRLPGWAESCAPVVECREIREMEQLIHKLWRSIVLQKTLHLPLRQDSLPSHHPPYSHFPRSAYILYISPLCHCALSLASLQQ